MNFRYLNQLTCCGKMLLVFLILSNAAAAAIPEKVEQVIRNYNLNVATDEVIETEIPGIYQMIIGQKVIYIDEKRNLLFNGELINLENDRNLTRETLRQFHLQKLKEIPRDQMIAYVPKKEKYNIYVFTDVECFYCRKFHSGMAEMMDLGIRVNYLFTPFRDDNNLRATAVWCADNRNEAMNKAKLGKNIPLKQCDTPIAKHMEIARAIGVSGTPAILLQNGELISGYREPQDLLNLFKRLKIKEAS